jgi:hypothetical protein
MPARLSARFSLRALFAAVGLCAVACLLLRFLVVRDEVVFIVDGESGARTIYLDKVPIGPVPCRVRESHLRRAGISTAPDPLPYLDVYGVEFFGQLHTVRTADGRHPMLWIRAEPGDARTIETPFGMALYYLARGASSHQQPGELPRLRIESWQEWFPLVESSAPATVAALDPVPITLSAPNDFSGRLPCETKVFILVSSDREAISRFVELTIASESWESRPDGRFSTSIELSGLPNAHYWVHGSIYYAADGFQRGSGKHNAIRACYFRVIDDETSVVQHFDSMSSL